MAGRVIYLNPSFTRVFGWSLEECFGKKMDHYVPEEAWRETQKMIEMARVGIYQYVEKPINRRDLAKLVRQVLDEKKALLNCKLESPFLNSA